jgi:hypothetical protein
MGAVYFMLRPSGISGQNESAKPCFGNQPSAEKIPAFVLAGLSQNNEGKLLVAGAVNCFEKSGHFLENKLCCSRPSSWTMQR